MTAKERDVVRGNNKWKGSVAGLGGLSGPVDILPFNFCCGVYTLCFFGMSVVWWCLCTVEGQKEDCLLVQELRLKTFNVLICF